MWLVDISLRVGAGMLAGALLGLDRERYNKPAGLRTLALVGLGSALFTTLGVTTAGPNNIDSVFRVVQGVISGIGFLGAGAILRRDDESGVRGRGPRSRFVTSAPSLKLASQARS